MRLISEAAASVAFAPADNDAMAKLIARPNVEEHGADLMEETPLRSSSG